MASLAIIQTCAKQRVLGLTHAYLARVHEDGLAGVVACLLGLLDVTCDSACCVAICDVC